MSSNVIERIVSEWERIAIKLYMCNFGARCVYCSVRAAVTDSTLIERGDEIMLMHTTCAEKALKEDS